MSPAKSLRSRTLFSAAAAMLLGLQIAPWPTAVMAQSPVPSGLNLQEDAQPIELVSRREQRRNRRPAQRAASEKSSEELTEPPLIQQQPQAQQMPQRQAVNQQSKSDVQRELEKLYQESGQAAPEMIDPRISQPAKNGTGGGANPTGQTAQPGGQQPAMTQGQVQSQSQGQAQQFPQGQPQAPAATPKKRNFFSKLFSKDDAPVQPPVETPYIPPTNAVNTPPAQLSNQPVQKAPGVVNYNEIFEEGNSSDNGAETQQQFNGTPGQPGTAGGGSLPQVNLNAPAVDSDWDDVNLGQAAPLTTPAQPVQPSEPADPFSDNSLFPGSTTTPANVATNNGVQTPDTQQAAPAFEAPATVATPATPETPDVANEEVEEVTENPYSGLTLDDNPFAKPAPRHTISITPRQVPLENVMTESKTTQTEPPALMAPPSEYTDVTADEEPPLVVEQRETRRPSRQAPVGSRQTRAKQEMIAAREGMSGLKGFCPVVLRDERNLVDAQSQYRAVYNSKTYYLSSSEAVTAFHADPGKYAPAARGNDVIQLAIAGEEIEGSLDYAVWYKGRLYMFSSAETMDTFVAAPSSHATLD